MKYSWLIFDADGTLFDFKKAQTIALEKTFDKMKLDFRDSYQNDYREVNIMIWEQLEQGLIDFDDVRTKRFEIFFRKIDITADHLLASDIYLNFLSQGSYLLDGAETLINSIYKNYRLVLLTNGLTSVQKPRFANAPITKYFNDIIISEEVGFAKPDKGIYDLCFSRMNNPDKREVLIIGDNLGSDILGGMNYGIDTCWFNPHGLQNDSEIKPTYEINNYNQLEEILL